MYLLYLYSYVFLLYESALVTFFIKGYLTSLAIMSHNVFDYKQTNLHFCRRPRTACPVIIVDIVTSWR